MREVSIIIFYNKDKKILLQNRKSISKFGEEWGYFGGKIEEGETKEKALEREVLEELTYKLKDYEYIGKFQSTIKENTILRYLFISELKIDLNKFKQEEGDGMKLFTLEEAKKLKMVKGDEIGLEMIEEKFT